MPPLNGTLSYGGEVKKRSGYTVYLIALLIIVFITSSWLFNYYMLNNLKNDEKAVTGDMFGAVNALYSGFALTEIILTILLCNDQS